MSSLSIRVIRVTLVATTVRAMTDEQHGQAAEDQKRDNCDP
jgi:hypothetical protein